MPENEFPFELYHLTDYIVSLIFINYATFFTEITIERKFKLSSIKDQALFFQLIFDKSVSNNDITWRQASKSEMYTL